MDDLVAVLLVLLVSGFVWLISLMRKKILSLFRGWFGEKKTTFYLWLSLNSKVYRKFHDIIIKTENGTTQIDHLLVSPYGLFIIETKNIKGWIFGAEDQKRWTQSLYGSNYSFQNPIRQTFRQKKVISEFFGVNESIVHTVIYFIGDCKFKTELPDNVINSRLGKHIKQFKDRVLSSEEIDRVVGEIEYYVSESSLTTKDHVQSLRERHNSTTVCPKCGSQLVERTAKKGPNAGTKFLGCENYPKCRFTKDI
ncbi:Topoisomerase DNA binding C4 zinc finger [Fodinibius salinus]|uniref:Topoisomerase DNA binding C4 zinc finger n=1 Tax=Fodinibius salinus TaxID=860790 RepID=A0A5D3YNJ0_9BACT|nr:NERD domain-containing protein [Fodinibius salinus]TYP95434.1 Topoisomerase DNA binding C4 zinc finger [Fodinibius salinus]